MCLLPLPLDTQMAPGIFTPVISEMDYYILTHRYLNDASSALISSLTSVQAIPLLLAVLTILNWHHCQLLDLIYLNRILFTSSESLKKKYNTL